MTVTEQEDLWMDGEVAAALDEAFEDELDPIPSQLTQFALEAFQWRLVDDELAAITFDSAVDELVGVRGTATLRHSMRFEGGGIAVSMSVTDASFVAAIEPAAEYLCHVEGPQTNLDVRSDENGQLAVSQTQLPLRLIVELPTGRVVTPWITG